MFYERRAYLPDVPRFATPDPIGELGGINLYPLVANSPVNRVDPLGESDFNRPAVTIIGGPQLTVSYGPPAIEPRISSADVSGLEPLGRALQALAENEDRANERLAQRIADLMGVGDDPQEVDAIKKGLEAALSVSMPECPKMKFPKLGWKGTKPWRDAILKIQQGGQKVDLGFIPTKDQALKLLKEAGVDITSPELRIDPAHLHPENPHSYPHINYPAPIGGKGTIQIQGL